ncbi:MAG: hypothetical protein R3B72_18325 [Polyangiaceae bacterium]
MDGIATKSRVGNEVLLRAGLDGQDRTVPTDAKVGEAVVGQVVGELVSVEVFGGKLGHRGLPQAAERS